MHCLKYTLILFHFQDIPFKSASIDEFEKQLDESESVADLLRIFFEQKDLSDFEINTILNMKSNKYVYGTHFKRENTPRIWMNDDEDAVSGMSCFVIL